MAVKPCLTKAEFDIMLKEAGDKLVVVDFHATWCGPCRKISPFVKELAEKNQDKMVVITVDVDENDETAQAYDVKAMPTFVFIKNMEELQDRKIVGADAKAIEKNVTDLIS